MKLKIVQAGEPVLRETARPLSEDFIRSDRVQQLIELMRETMRDAPGVGHHQVAPLALDARRPAIDAGVAIHR